MSQTSHGVLVNVDGVGVLLFGEASVGKSECALELISRGHRLVADDVVLIERRGDILVGAAPERFAGLIEIRDLGIFDVRRVFSEEAYCAGSAIDMCIELRKASPEQTRERLGAKTEKIVILDLELPKLYLKVERGRNVAVLVETSVRLFQCGPNPTEAAIIYEHDKLVSAT